ncbi:MAG: cysteine desulfurase-like protein [Sphingomonadales bacterium]|nr:cysteine desulfurase-like protein [Sphingomonadales bacterium]
MHPSAHHIDEIRARFPSLSVEDDGRQRIYLDNPAGTQVPVHVIERMTDYFGHANANLGGYFPTSERSEEVVDEAHAAMADFLNAASAEEIVFGQNMTTLTFHVSRSIGRLFSPGDEIIVTRMDHDANIAPWLMLAEDLDLTIRWLDIDTETFELDLEKFEALLSSKTRLLAVGYASNLIGTINDVKRLTALAKSAGALVYVDAVQYAPHGLIDVQDIGCDFLVCSPYKFYGPHLGVLWGRAELLNALTAYKVRAASDVLPEKFETGTLSHESLAGLLGTMDYLAWYGNDGSTSRRQALQAAYDVMRDYENDLAWRLIEGLGAIPSVKIQGIADHNRLMRRVPTVSITSEARTPREMAEHLAAHNIFVWDGHSYALELVRALGLADKGGVLRIGIAHYNTVAEIDRTVKVLDDFLR